MVDRVCRREQTKCQGLGWGVFKKRALKREFKSQVVELLDQHRLVTLATNRPDGWPQATVVGYVNDGLILYTFIARDSQKFTNLKHDKRISGAIAKDYPQPLQIKGLSFGGVSEVCNDP